MNWIFANRKWVLVAICAVCTITASAD